MNLKQEIYQTIINNNVKEAESILDRYIIKDKENIDLLLRLAVTVITVPLLDVDKGLHCIKKVQNIAQYNVKAKLLECCIYKYNFGGINEELYYDLCNLKTNNIKELSMIEFVKSWKCLNDKKNQMFFLERSIDIDDTLVWNNIYLGRLRLELGNIEEGISLLYNGINNIKHIFSNYDIFDFTNYDMYISEHIEGSYMTIINLQEIVASIVDYQYKLK